MPVALITPEKLYQQDDDYVARLRQAGFDVVYPEAPLFSRGKATEKETIAQLTNCDAVIAGGEHYTPGVFTACPQLKVIARAGVGYDRVNIPAATQNNVAVTITPNSNHEAVAELALALLFAVAKSVPVNHHNVRTGKWRTALSQPLRGKTIGIFGLGRIGRSLAIRVGALGMRVIASEKYPQQDFLDEHNIELVERDELLQRADFVSLHCPLNEETRDSFNAATFARMKSDSVLINTARGGLVVEEDLVAAIQSGHLAGAGLDVFQQEPPNISNPLLALDQVVCMPHIAGMDEKSQFDMAMEAADCIIRLSKNEWPAGAVVNEELRGGWSW